MTPDASVSVIIPALNEEAAIDRAIESAWTAGADEVIVADGGSEDATCEIAERLECKVVVSAAGRGTQQNVGARQATGDVLLFLHADNWLDDDAVRQVRTVMKDASVRGGALRQRIDARALRYRLLEVGNAMRVRMCGLPYGDQAIFMWRDVFWELGGFPAEPLMEDLMLMKAFRKRWRPVLLPGPVQISARRWQRHGIVRQTLRNWSLLVRHACGQSPKQLARLYRRHDL